MAFDVKRSTGEIFDTTFMQGYPYPAKYHNMGQLMTPYEGKRMGQSGDYGPPQSTTYYTPDNSSYPYPLDKFSNNTMYLPGASCCCYNDQYPDGYIPGNYFGPAMDYPDMKKVRTAQNFNTFPTGTRPNFHLREGTYPSDESKREGYGGRGNDEGSYNQRGYNETGMFLYRRLPVAPEPDLTNSNHFPPFNNFY